MKWRSALFGLIWAIVVLLLLFPTLCQNLTICARSSTPLAIILGIVGAGLAVSDAVRVRREARERLFRDAQKPGVGPEPEP
jgi:hypothetical protein